MAEVLTTAGVLLGVGVLAILLLVGVFAIASHRTEVHVRLDTLERQMAEWHAVWGAQPRNPVAAPLLMETSATPRRQPGELLRSHAVAEDGAIEYSDGERVEPDVTKINPPAMRMAED